MFLLAHPKPLRERGVCLPPGRGRPGNGGPVSHPRTGTRRADGPLPAVAVAPSGLSLSLFCSQKGRRPPTQPCLLFPRGAHPGSAFQNQQPRSLARPPQDWPWRLPPDSRHLLPLDGTRDLNCGTGQRVQITVSVHCPEILHLRSDCTPITEAGTRTLTWGHSPLSGWVSKQQAALTSNTHQPQYNPSPSAKHVGTTPHSTNDHKT